MASPELKLAFHLLPPAPVDFRARQRQGGFGPGKQIRLRSSHWTKCAFEANITTLVG